MPAPFLPVIDDPPTLLGIDPLSPGQIYGVHLAFLSYHTLRHENHITQILLSSTLKAIVEQCPIAKHITLAYFGKVSLRFPPSCYPTLPVGFAATQTHTTDSSSGPGPGLRSLSSPPQTSLPNMRGHHNAKEFPQNVRLRMSHQRIADLRARGIPVASGPLFPRHRRARSADLRSDLNRGVPGSANTVVELLAT